MPYFLASAQGISLLMRFGVAAPAVGTLKVKVKLHTGNPGALGTANVATENTEKEIELQEEAFLTPANWPEGRKSNTAGEWVEVKAAETYKWISIRNSAGTFLMNVELTAPVAVVIGDTFRINKGALILKVVSEA